MRARILNAGAGSGKTYQLAYKYVRDLIGEPGRYRHILAVTFTNKATEEMKTRILERIHELASGAASPYLEALCRELSLDAGTVRSRAQAVRSAILHDYSHFTVLTIDKFFQRILRAFIRELGIAPDYNTEIETDAVVGRSADLLVDEIAVDAELRRWLMAFVQERIEEGRRWDIREGVLALSGELFKERNRPALGAGCSKAELDRIVARATARTRQSQAEMRRIAAEAVGRIDRAGLGLADFPYKSSGFAAYFYKTAREVFEPYGARVRDACTKESAWGKAGSPVQALRAELQPALQALCALYDRNVRFWNTTALLRENYRSFALLADLYAKVQTLCNEENMMLLSETKYILSEFIGRNDAPFIYEKAGTRFDRFMIDEFQDTSAREWENFLPLLLNAMAQSEETSVLLVGDIKQSIYRWRGGDWRILHTAAREALGAGETEVVRLKENYRSLPAVVEFNNRIVGGVVAADNARLNAELLAAAESGRLSAADKAALTDTLADAYDGHTQTAARRSDRPGYVRIAPFDGAPPVVECIRELLDRGFRPKDILILVRSNSEGARVAETLLAFKRTNDDPRYRFDVMTQEALLVGRAPVCAFVAAALRLAVKPADPMSEAVYNGYLGRPYDTPLPEEELSFCREIRLLAPEEAFERIVMRHRLHERRSENAYLQAIHEAIIRFSARKTADIPLFLRWWDETGSGQSLSVEQSETTVGIMTVHKAKGLQNKAVILPYCSWPLDPDPSKQPVVWGEARTEAAEGLGRFPIKYKRGMADSHFSAEYYRELVYTNVDNINLLYVALTRAEEELHIYIPNEARNRNHVGSLVAGCIAADGGACELDGMRGRCTPAEAGVVYEFGRAEGPAPQRTEAPKTEHLVLEDYATAQPALRLRLPSQRYFEEEETSLLAPRNLGILLHKAFENAATEAEILGAIGEMQANAQLSQAEAAALRDAVGRALEDERVREWFGGGWDAVHNEREIVVPRDSRLRRPDRVMTRGRRAVVVDYKFGRRDPERYRRQLREYADLLRGMGYDRTEGYLWYVKLGTIEKVV